MRQPARPPSQAPHFGCSGQGRTEPELVHLYHQWTRLSTDANGEIHGLPLQGFYCAETQFVSAYRVRLNGEAVDQRFSAQLSPTRWSSLGTDYRSYENEETEPGKRPEGSLELQILRSVDEAWIERVFVRNNGAEARRFSLEIELDARIEDLEFPEELKQQKRPTRGQTKPVLKRTRGSVELTFERRFGRRARTPELELARLAGKRTPRDGEPVVRALRVRARFTEARGLSARVSASRARTLLRLQGKLGAHAEAGVSVTFEACIDGRWLRAPAGSDGFEPLPTREPLVPLDGMPRIETGNSALNLVLAQAQVDFQALRLGPFVSEGVDPDEYMAFTAGVPRYIGVFGRDILTVAWQAALVANRLIEPCLNRMAAYQGVREDPWRDEEPGRLPHELRLDAGSAVGELNRNLYYGDVTATPFWLIALLTAWRWTGDRAMLRRQRRSLLNCCSWIERRLEQGDGFIYYAPALPGRRGQNRNQAWKDSGDAIVDERGAIVGPPLAVTEIQGYAYQALLAAAELLEALGERGERLDGLRAKAGALKRRFNERFWLEDERYFALALDDEGNPVRAIASNAGHCLGTGIIDGPRAALVIDRLMRDDLFSGWGIRTLSSLNPSFDPFSYHRGSVWPVENATIAGGFARHGRTDEAARVVAAQLSAALLFPFLRLPETLSGHPRSRRFPTPGIYPFANPMQTWSVSALFMHVQTLLGLRPDAPAGRLDVKPNLPEWLPWLELRGLRVGAASLDLRFEREGGRTRTRCLRKTGVITILEARDENRVVVEEPSSRGRDRRVSRSREGDRARVRSPGREHRPDRARARRTRGRAA